jgi:hypothetical protein
VDVTAHTAPSQQAVSFPLEVMEVWINRRKVFIPYKPPRALLNMDGERSLFFRGAPDHIEDLGKTIGSLWASLGIARWPLSSFREPPVSPSRG